MSQETFDEAFRIETDSIGEVKVELKNPWGAQTQRSIQNFNIGSEKMPKEVITALILIKKAAAIVNLELGKIDIQISDAITSTCDELIKNYNKDYFPLSVWQTGSGTQTNMNVNEVIANVANLSFGKSYGSKSPIHPNDHVNLGQSSNDTFPAAMNIAAALSVNLKLLPCLKKLHKAFEDKAQSWKDIIKIGRTHMQDATPMTLGQEFSGYAAQIENGIARVKNSMERVYHLAQGGTAVGTGINTPKKFGEKISKYISNETNLEFITSSNKFEALACNDSLVELSGSLNTLAVSLMKIANDIRILGSGPRCSIGEIDLPKNEPGSSIMPGKTNPTQCEALTMICSQVMGNNTAISIAGSNGHLELNVFKPVIIYNLLQSIELLRDGCTSFMDNCLIGITPNLQRIDNLVSNSLMLVTALTPVVGYDNCARIANLAYDKNISLKKASIELGLLTGEEFDDKVVLQDMIESRD